MKLSLYKMLIDFGFTKEQIKILIEAGWKFEIFNQKKFSLTNERGDFLAITNKPSSITIHDKSISEIKITFHKFDFLSFYLSKIGFEIYN